MRGPKNRFPTFTNSYPLARIQNFMLARGWNFMNDVNDDLIIRLSPVPETRLHEIRIPTLIVVGELDASDCFEDADVLEEKRVGSEKVILSHMSNMEDPAGFNKAVLGFPSKHHLA